VPWIAIAAQLVISAPKAVLRPGFVVAIFVTLLLLFNSFAANMWLQSRGRGRWAERRSPSAFTSCSALSPRARSPGRSTPARLPEADHST
jgi:hypothetical protein